MKLFHPQILLNNRIIMDKSQEIIIFFDSNGKILDYNTQAANELGYGEDIFYIKIDDVFKNAFQYENNRLMVTTRFQNSPQETIAYRKNQTCFPVEFRASFINKKNKYFGICTAINISDKKEAIQELTSLKTDLNNHNQISVELVARIAHELRTPVNGIMGFSNNLLDMEELKQEQKEAVGIIKRCCNSMNAIINDLLDYAKLSNKKLIIEQREFSIRRLIRNIVDINIPKINEKGLKLSVNISNEIPDRVIGDEHRLSQVLNNLFSNAIKFTLIGQINLEVLKITQMEQSLELFFMLIDTGIGIGSDEKDKLFKSFSQVDSSITRRFGGTGLGLAICKRLVEAMNGTIQVDSEKNKGSTFSFSVRLGLPKTGSISYSKPECQKSRNIESGDIANTKILSDMEYINIMLQDINEKNVDKSLNALQENKDYINDLLERLTICIEMENWEKSEELAYQIKNSLLEKFSESSNILLRLLLAVRKENHDISLSILEEIKTSIFKEK